MTIQRLQKIMAAAGIASRRKSEELITSGRVSVNGQAVTELGAKADEESDHIRVDGKLLHGPERKVYVMLNKPVGYVTTVSDPEGRPTVMHLVRNLGVRLFPVGRLDYASEGLLLLTNDGDLAQKLTRAASHVPKTYLVKVAGQPAAEALQRLRDGIYLRGEDPGERPVKTAPARILPVREADNPWYEVTLTEGRNRQIRRMFEQIGHRVEKIKRVRYGPMELDVMPGEYRRLTPQEVEKLERWQATPVRRPQFAPRPYASRPNVALKADKPGKRARWSAVPANSRPQSSRPYASKPSLGSRGERDTDTRTSTRSFSPAARTARADAAPRRVEKRPGSDASRESRVTSEVSSGSRFASGGTRPPSSSSRSTTGPRFERGADAAPRSARPSSFRPSPGRTDAAPRSVEKRPRVEGAFGSTRPSSSRPTTGRTAASPRFEKSARPHWAGAPGSDRPPSSRPRAVRAESAPRFEKSAEKRPRWAGAPGSDRPPSSRPRAVRADSAPRFEKSATKRPQRDGAARSGPSSRPRTGTKKKTTRFSPSRKP